MKTTSDFVSNSGRVLAGLLLIVALGPAAHAATVYECTYMGFYGNTPIQAAIDVSNADATMYTTARVKGENYTQRYQYQVLRHTPHGLYLASVRENQPDSGYDYRVMTVVIVDTKNGGMTIANIFASGLVEHTSGTCNPSSK